MTSNSETRTMSHRNRPSKYLILAIFACLFLLPVLYYGINSELARWTAARAQLQYDAGDPESAILTMEVAIKRSPNDQRLKLIMSDFLMRNGRAERALRLIDEVLAVDSDSAAALNQRADCLMYLGRADEALEAIKTGYDQIPTRNVNELTRLNHLAYYRGLAGKEIERAKTDINEALKQHSLLTWWGTGLPMAVEDQALVAAAMISRGIGQQNEVLEMLNGRIEFFEGDLNRSEFYFAKSVYDDWQQAVPLVGRKEKQIRRDLAVILAIKKFLAILYSVRALIYQDLDLESQRDLNRWAVKELGFEADQLIEPMPDDWQFLVSMDQAAQLLDTRAVVNSARVPTPLAVHDLNVAILAESLISMTFAGPIQNTIRDENGQRFSRDRNFKSLAVMLKHRSDLFRKLGQTKEAQRDLQRIEELGFDNNETLF